MTKPSESAFHDPATWQQDKAFVLLRAQDDLQVEATMCQYPVKELAAIATIDPNQTQLLAGTTEPLKEQLGPIAVLHRGCGDDNSQE